MIDIEPEVYTAVYRVLKEAYPSLNVLNVEPSGEASLPAVYFYQMSNVSDPVTRETDSKREYSTAVTFQTEVYTASSNKKGLSREIVYTVDDVLSSEPFGMRRTQAGSIPNLYENTIYRFIMRHTCSVTKYGVIY